MNFDLSMDFCTENRLQNAYWDFIIAETGCWSLEAAWTVMDVGCPKIKKGRNTVVLPPFISYADLTRVQSTSVPPRNFQLRAKCLVFPHPRASIPRGHRP